MSSLIPGYEYDIFISYRQKDNKYDGWVTEFVNNLKRELEATFKEDISIYFDENPHDGLLETHDVDESLKDKVKCLVFMPIISQTYCDPKSFAWRNEFLVFKKFANDDEFGLKVKLANGNVASRILPVRIHELEADDKALLENELGTLRSVDFIFISPGVNRPLRINEDHPNDNTNHTFYRDQINKVANAVKEILNSLQGNNLSVQAKMNSSKRDIHSGRSKLRIGAAIISALIISLVLFYFWKPGSSANQLSDPSVAVLAFIDLSENKDQEWFSDGLTEEILNSLSKMPGLKVSARTSSFYFKGKDVPVPQIAEMLGVEHVVEGSVRRIGDHLRITIQLVRAKDGFHLWSKTFDDKADDLFRVQTEIAETIARLLVHEFSPESAKLLQQDKTDNTEAYEYYLKGMFYHTRYHYYRKKEDFKRSESMFLKSISHDPRFASAYAELANLYDSHSVPFLDSDEHNYWWNSRDSLVKIAYRINPYASGVLHIKGYTFFTTLNPVPDSAFF
jgi:TolB-like protein